MQSRAIAVIGGIGKEGSGFALRWEHAGHRVLIGSLAPERALLPGAADG
jgi:predicted dinucleotide-binding enzyme